jgi:hypothetical protein
MLRLVMLVEGPRGSVFILYDNGQNKVTADEPGTSRNNFQQRNVALCEVNPNFVPEVYTPSQIQHPL